MRIKVGVFGASGRMGATVCQMVAAEPDLELVAAVDPHHAGLDVRQAIGVEVPGLMITPNTDGLEQSGVEVRSIAPSALLTSGDRPSEGSSSAMTYARRIDQT